MSENSTNMSSDYNRMKLPIKNRKKLEIHKYVKTNQQTPNYWCFKEEFKIENTEYVGMNENGDTTYQNVWDAEKSVLKGKFIAVNT